MGKALLTFIVAFVAFAGSAVAEEFEYSPDHCQFTITFPEEPYTSRRCDENGSDRCYDLISYTEVFELSATVNFRVICNPIADSIYDQYDENVMKSTLHAMSKRNGIATRNASYREEAGFKQAGLAGEGQVGATPMIYIAQLWIGEDSAFSLEAELIGDQYDAADQLFSDVLRTVRFSDGHDQDAPVDEDASKKDILKN